MRLVSDSELVARLATLEGSQRGAGSSLGDRVRVVVGGNAGTPRHLLGLFDSAVPRYRLFMINAQDPVPHREGVIHETPFVGPGMRLPAASTTSRLDYLPMRLSLVPHLFERFRPPDVVLVQASPPRTGRVSLGIEVNILVGAIEQARARHGLVVAQLNSQMPWTRGDAELDTRVIDLAIEADEPLLTASASGPSDRDAAIGDHVASLVSDRSTLQLGIGAIPNATLASLVRRRNLAVWSEMVSDGVLLLERSGALEPDHAIVASFLFGSDDLYRWADGSTRLRLLRTEHTNDPGQIARKVRMTSINTALQVDLFAQANATYVGDRVYSGFGGQTDFIVGALHASGGQAVIALPSWHRKTDASTVLARLQSPITSFQHSSIVSEHGAAQIFGRSQRAQAQLIIDQAAHPDVRDELRSAAAALGLA